MAARLHSLGIRNNIFPEVNYDNVDKVRGMDIVIVTTAKSIEEHALLKNPRHAFPR